MTLPEVQERITGHCEEMLTYFKPGAQITVVVVNDGHGDAGMVVCSGDIVRAREEINRRLSMEPKEKRFDEDNSTFCMRRAREMDQTKLIQALLRLIKSRIKSKRFKQPLWSYVSDAIHHGCGVSTAVCVHYLGDGQDE